MVGLQVDDAVEPDPLPGFLHDLSGDGLSWGLSRLQTTTGEGPQARYGGTGRALGAQQSSTRPHDGVGGDALIGTNRFAGLAVVRQIRHTIAGAGRLGSRCSGADMGRHDDLVVHPISGQVLLDDEAVAPQFNVRIHTVTDAEGMGLPTAWRSDRSNEHTFIQPPWS